MLSFIRYPMKKIIPIIICFAISYVFVSFSVHAQITSSVVNQVTSQVNINQNVNVVSQGETIISRHLSVYSSTQQDLLDAKRRASNLQDPVVLGELLEKSRIWLTSGLQTLTEYLEKWRGVVENDPLINKESKEELLGEIDTLLISMKVLVDKVVMSSSLEEIRQYRLEARELLNSVRYKAVNWRKTVILHRHQTNLQNYSNVLSQLEEQVQGDQDLQDYKTQIRINLEQAQQLFKKAVDTYGLNTDSSMALPYINASFSSLFDKIDN